jgi:probable rRNA maturation factor
VARTRPKAEPKKSSNPLILAWGRWPKAVEAPLRKRITNYWAELRRRRVLSQTQADQKVLVAIVTAAESQRLNFQFRGKKRPTDVLSFAPLEASDLGELVLCHSVIAQQAKGNGWSVVDEYAYMILHGVLHLLGYDHETSDNAARRMYRLQDSVFFDGSHRAGPNTGPKSRVNHERRNRTDRNQIKTQKHGRQGR